MIRAYIANEDGGYVVTASVTDSDGDGALYRLRNFGEYKSAAMEFRNFINDNDIDADTLERKIRGWSQTYDPKKLFTYPVIRDRKTVTLKRQ